MRAREYLVSYVEDILLRALRDRSDCSASAQGSITFRLLDYLQAEGVDISSDGGAAVAATLADEAVFLMVSGLDNSAYMLSRSMQLLYQNPEWFRRMQEEQDALRMQFGDEIGQDVRPSPLAPFLRALFWWNRHTLSSLMVCCIC